MTDINTPQNLRSGMGWLFALAAGVLITEVLNIPRQQRLPYWVCVVAVAWLGLTVVRKTKSWLDGRIEADRSNDE